MLTRYFWYKPFSSKKIECQQLQLLLQSFGFAAFIKIHLKLRKKPGVFSWKLPRILGSNLNPSAPWLRRWWPGVPTGETGKALISHNKNSPKPVKNAGTGRLFPLWNGPFSGDILIFQWGVLKINEICKRHETQNPTQRKRTEQIETTLPEQNN